MEENENLEVESLEPITDGEHEEHISEEVIDLPESEEDVSEESSSEEIEKKSEDEVRRKKQKIDQLKRDKYRALNRIKELEQKVNQLENYSAHSNQAAMVHYDTTVQLRLEKARQKLAQAIETGDIPNQIEANEEIAEVKADEKYLKSWKAQQEYRAPPQPDQPPSRSYYDDREQEESEDLNEEAQQWIRHNPWFNENSPDYDPDMADEVKNYMQAVNRRLIRTGQQNKYCSPNYFNEIDNYIQKNFDDVEIPQKKEIFMKPIPKAVAPVGRANGALRKPDKEKIRLSDNEKFWAKNMGLTEEEWIRTKIAEEKKLIMKGKQI